MLIFSSVITYNILLTFCWLPNEMDEVKVGKLPIIASYTCNFISKLLQGGKNMVAFCTTVQKSH